MVKFLKIQYKLGRITEKQLDNLVKAKKITQKDKGYIIAK